MQPPPAQFRAVFSVCLPPAAFLSRSLYTILRASNDLNSGRVAPAHRGAYGAVATPTPSRFLQFESLGLTVRATPVGRLLVSSTPSGAVITIDDAFRGYTQRRFIVSVGPHVVDIKTADDRIHCIRPLNVAPDKSVSLNCPDLAARLATHR